MTPGEKPVELPGPFNTTDIANGDALPPIVPTVVDINTPAPTWLSWPGRWGGSGSGTFGSPDGPAQKGIQWLSPRTWGAQQRGCWERGAARVEGRTKARTAAPEIRATLHGRSVRVIYGFSKWAANETRPTMILVAVHPADNRIPPFIHRHRITQRFGVLRQPVGMGRGPFEVSVAAYSKDGRSSATVTVRARSR